MPLRRRAVFCAPCAAAVVADGRLVDEVWAAVAYGGAVAESLRRLKYTGRVDVAPQLAGLLAPAARALEAELVIPVPLHPVRLVERGFNQAMLLARPLGLRLSPGALARIRPTPQQTSLARAARLENVAGAFRARPELVAGKRVLLIDDVVTTGATLGACRAALLEAGAKSVAAIAVARAQ